MGKVLIWSLVGTSLFVVLEVGAGIEAHSLSLLSDAAHNFTDALALLLAWFGVYFGRRPPDSVKTYGYHRAGVLAAFVNALSLVILAGYIFFESYQRWLHPQKVQEMTMLVVAAVGLLVNSSIMWGLRGERGHDVNIRSAWAHMLGDALGSLGIVAGALVIRYTGWQRTDPLLSALIGLLIVWTAWDIIKETLNILLEGLPRGLDLDEVTAAMRQVPDVLDAHDVHIWSLGSSTRALSCHVLIEDVPPSASDSVLRNLKRMLHERFLIQHTTVQFEHVSCPGCPIPERQTTLSAPEPRPRPCAEMSLGAAGRSACATRTGARGAGADNPAALGFGAAGVVAIPIDGARNPEGRKVQAELADAARDDEHLVGVHQILRLRAGGKGSPRAWPMRCASPGAGAACPARRPRPARVRPSGRP